MFPFVLPDNPQILIISQNIGGQLQIHTDWPTPLRHGLWILMTYIGTHLLLHKMHKRMPQCTMAQALKKFGIKDFAKMMTLAPILSRQNYFR